MKRTLVALAVLLFLPAVSLSAYAATVLHCTGTDGKTPCTNTQMFFLNKNLVSARDSFPSLANVRYVSMGKDGALKCIQTDGTACTDDELKDIIKASANYTSPAGAFTVTGTSN